MIVPSVARSGVAALKNATNISICPSHQQTLTSKYNFKWREGRHTLIIPDLPIDIFALPPHMREIENHSIPPLSLSQFFLRQSGRINTVHDALPLSLEILHITLGLRILFQQDLPTIERRGHHVSAAMMFDD